MVCWNSHLFNLILKYFLHVEVLDNHSTMLSAGSSPDLANRQQIVDDMVKILQSEKVAQTSEKVSALQEFQLYVREGDASHIKRNFRYNFSTRNDFFLFYSINRT